MPYFPIFIDLCGKPCLIVGGGAVAARKAEKLLPYGPVLTVVAPEVCDALDAMEGVTLLRREFVPEDLDGIALVIAAATPEVNGAVSALCQGKNIPVNAVDDRENCTFLFPALVRKGELSVGISTGGASPSAAVWVRDRVEDCLPDGLDAILDFLQQVRPLVKEQVVEENRRSRFFAALFSACMERGRPLTWAELAEFLEVSS